MVADDNYLTTKYKVKVVSVFNLNIPPTKRKSTWGQGCNVPCILNFRSRQNWVASFTMWVVCPQGSVPGYETLRFLEAVM